MKKKTYLQGSLRNGKLFRWSSMPVTVYIAPMNFYSKKGQDYKYKALVKQAFDEWRKVSNGKVSFVYVNKLEQANIDICWQRVDREALGYCTPRANPKDPTKMLMAEIQIGLTEGLVHADYMDESEVYHTILHEIGHALGLDHSPFKNDIMYVPHQKGITHIGEGDRLTINWLYTFPQGKTVNEIASKYGVGANDLDELVVKILDKKAKSEFQKVQETVEQTPERNLLDENDNIAAIRKYHMALQNIKISNDLTEQIRKYHRDSSNSKD